MMKFHIVRNQETTKEILNIYSLTISELKKIKAGATFSASLINALVRGINSFLDVGRYFGSSIRRIIGGNICPL